MNSLRSIFKKNPMKNFNILSGYNPQDINMEYDNIGHDLNDMASNFNKSWKKMMEESNELSDNMEEELMYVAEFYDP